MKSAEEIIKPYKKELETTDYKGMACYDVMLLERWGKRVPKGWYGFSDINSLWGKIINDFLIELEKECPDFEIHQIKLKYGGLRFYVDLGILSDNKRDRIEKEVDKLEDILYSPKLVY